MVPTVVIAAFLLLWCGTESLRWGDEGVCRRERSGSDRRVKLECCNNWKYNFKTKKCVFYCHLGCGAGKCVGPNKCSCEPPNVYVDGKCVEPTCEPACVNATCIGQNICSCKAGYEKLNATHCAPPCLTGYERPCGNGTYETYERACENGTCTDSVECVPICEVNCVNATCVGPNTCSCRAGYEKLNATHCVPPCPPGYERACGNGECGDSLKCVPICQPSCINGDCTKPGICQCHEGFTNTSRWQCDPVCDDCRHGTCVAPNNCRCDDGYSMRDERCLPVCESCINGTCTAPGVCTCHPGYIADKENPSICYKPCDGPCGNGTCVNSTCECLTGYRLLNGTCVPPLPVLCKDCDGVCNEDSECFCSDDRPCLNTLDAESAEVASAARLAGLELTWLVGGVVGLIIITSLIVIISYMWRKRQEYGAKSTAEQGNTYTGSVVYTVSNTLLHNRDEERQEVLYDIPNEKDPNKAASEALLEEEAVPKDNMYD